MPILPANIWQVFMAHYLFLVIILKTGIWINNLISIIMAEAWELKTDDSRSEDTIATFIIFCEDEATASLPLF